MLRRLLTISLASALATLSAACSTTVSGGTDVCQQWRGVTWSLSDTPDTQADVKGNNARRKAWCADK